MIVWHGGNIISPAAVLMIWHILKTLTPKHLPKMNNITSEQLKKLKIVFRTDTLCVSGFITNIWNEHRFDKIGDYLHEHFIDHSIPPGFLNNSQGLVSYLEELTSRVSHYTHILEINTAEDFILCKIRVDAVCVSKEDLAASGPEAIEGYRLFQMKENKIIGHWDMM